MILTPRQETLALNMNHPSRPALRYYGSKWQLASWIYSYLPPHEHRVIPFAGSLSDTLRWPMPKLETANDLDGRVFNFFKVLRDRPTELIRAIKLTPWHEAEYQQSREPSLEPFEDARRFWTTCWMSIQGGPNPSKSGFRFMKSREKRFSIIPSDATNIDHLYDVAERLKHIQFLNKDALEVIAKFQDEPNTLIYLDPPYVSETRATTTGYTHEGDEDLHTAVARLVHECAGYIVICGYDSVLYDELYPDWHTVRHPSRVNGGASKIETLWLSPRAWQALKRPFQASLFGGTSPRCSTSSPQSSP